MRSILAAALAAAVAFPALAQQSLPVAPPTIDEAELAKLRSAPSAPR